MTGADVEAGSAGWAVEVEHLTKRFGAFVAVDGLCLAVRRGEIFGFLGSNGAGKSTAIRMLCGLLTPTSGTAQVLGIDVGTQPDRVKPLLGYMSQRFSLYEDLTVVENLRFFAGVYRLPRVHARQRVDWALHMSGLAGRETMLTRALPGGWKQRLALACAVLHDPRVLFLDEPTSGVDPIARRRFWDLIDQMAAAGVTVFVTTHALDEAEHCDRIALMHAGKLIALGSVPQLRTVFADRAVLEVSCPRTLPALEALQQQPWVQEASVFGNRLHVLVQDEAQARRQVGELLDGQRNAPWDVQAIVPSLEDIFLHLIEGSGSSDAAVA